MCYECWDKSFPEYLRDDYKPKVVNEGSSLRCKIFGHKFGNWTEWVQQKSGKERSIRTCFRCETTEARYKETWE